MKVDTTLLKSIITTQVNEIETIAGNIPLENIDQKSFIYGKYEGERIAYCKILNIISEMEEFRNRREELNEIGEIDD
ncbi:MAG: hypothetical protein E6987_01180 [Peptoniphilus harei]|nr:hypothetical protein [Peptoniphilus harei]